MIQNQEKNNNSAKVSEKPRSKLEKNSLEVSNCFSNDFVRLTRSSSNSSNSAAKFGPAIQSSSSTNVSKADLPSVEDNVELPVILLSGPEESSVAAMEESTAALQFDENSDVAHQKFLDNCLESDSMAEQEVLEEHSDSDLEELMEDSPSIEEVEQIVEAMTEEPRNNGRFIEATPADDEFQMHHQDLRFWQGRGPPRDGRGNGWRSASQSGRGSGQGRGRGRRNRDSLATAPAPVSMDVLPSSGPSPNDATDEGRRKRTRESNEDPAMQVVGGEEPKGDDSFTIPSSPDPFLPQP